MKTARIYQRPKNAMQSGRARTDRWILEFEPREPQRPDPLTGWAGSGDTANQVRLNFPTLEAAKDYATREGLAYHVIPAPERNFTWWSYRAQDWAASDRGRRLDHMWASPGLASQATAHRVLEPCRGWDRPSDHVPLILELEV